MLSKSKEKTIGTYLKLVDSLVKPVILYAYECWSNSMKKEIFAKKIEQFHMTMCKQILGVKRFTNSIKVLSELGRAPLKIDIEINRYLFKAFKEE